MCASALACLLALLSVLTCALRKRCQPLSTLRQVRLEEITFEPDKSIDVGAIKFKDKAREKQRVKKYQELLVEQAKKKEQDYAKKLQKKEKAKKLVPKRRKKSRHQEICDEWDDLASEERQFKKMKRGKISSKQYDESLLSHRKHDDKDEDEDDDSGSDDGGGGAKAKGKKRKGKGKR